MLKKTLSLLIIILGFHSYSQNGINYTVEDGLPSNNIYHIIQDNKGFIWIATNRGIAKFDGTEFKTFTTKKGLPNNDIWRLAIDKEDRVWFNTKSKYQGYIQHDSVYKFTTVDKKTKVPVFFNTNQGKVILTQGVEYYEQKNNSFIRLNSHLIDKQANQFTPLYKSKGVDQTYSSAHFNHDAREYFFWKKDSVYFYDTSLNLVSQLKFGDEDLAYQKKSRPEILYGMLPNYTSFYEDLDGVLLINFKTKRTRYLSHNEFRGGKIFKRVPLIIASNNTIQISFTQHLLVLDNNFNIIEQRYFPDFPDNMNSYMDKAGNVWLNDQKKGLVLISKSEFETTTYLKQKRIQQVSKLTNRVIAGEYDEGLLYYLKEEDKFEYDKSIPIKKNIYHIKTNHRTKQNIVVSRLSYISSSDSFNREDKLDISFGKGFKHNNFKDIEFCKENLFVIAGGTVVMCDKVNKSILTRGYPQALNVIREYKGRLYAGGNEGLFLYEKDTLISVLPNNEFASEPIKFLLSDEINLYVGTDGKGVFIYDEKKGIHLKNTDGLLVLKIIKKGDKLWLSTQNGVQVVQLTKDNLEDSPIINAYYTSDGLLQNNTNDILLEDSLLWVATDIGLSKLNINSSCYKLKSPVLFDFNFDTVTYKYSNEDQISARFHVLNYVNQGHMSFEYRLLPKITEWKSTNSSALNFSGLPPNFYTLEVRAIDQHNNISQGKQVIVITPKWWQSSIVKIAVGFFMLLGLFFIIKYILIRVKKAEQKKSRLAKIELKALRAQMNPHFVHNSLNAILYYIQRNENELSERYLVTFSKLIRRFFEYSRKEYITLKEEIELLRGYLDIEQLRFEDKLNYEINIDPNIDTEERIIPSMILQPIVENSVNHGLFHKKEKGTIQIELKEINSETYSIVIEDDGIGINQAREIFDNSAKNYQSRSSAVLDERLNLLKGNQEWEINYVIKDLSDICENKGTRVDLTFKQIYKK